MLTGEVPPVISPIQWLALSSFGVMTFRKSSVRYTQQRMPLSYPTKPPVLCPVADDQNGVFFEKTTMLDTTPWKTNGAPHKLPSSQNKIFDDLRCKECNCQLVTRITVQLDVDDLYVNMYIQYTYMYVHLYAYTQETIVYYRSSPSSQPHPVWPSTMWPCPA